MKSFHLNWKQLAGLVGFVLLFFLLMDLNSRTEDLTRLDSQLGEMQTEVGGLKATEFALSTNMVYSTSDAAVSEYARSHGMVQDDEKLVVPLAEGTPQPLQYVDPTPVMEPVTNLDIWWALFFGQ